MLLCVVRRTKGLFCLGGRGAWREREAAALEVLKHESGNVTFGVILKEHAMYRSGVLCGPDVGQTG